MNFLPSLYIITLFIIGTAIGSFISVVSYRLHTKEKGIFRGRSKCPECASALEVRDLIPLISYLALRGKCRQCNKEISFLYPILEIVSGFLFVALFYRYPFFDPMLNFDINHFLLYVLWGFYTFILIFTFFHDLHYYKIADHIIIPGILVGLLATLSPATVHLIDALIGLLIAVGFFGLQIIISKGRWLGGGDLRIGAFMGIILGWKLTVVAMMIAYLIGSLASIVIIVKKKQFYGIKIPFAPFLVTGTFAAFYFGERIISWYVNHLGV